MQMSSTWTGILLGGTVVLTAFLWNLLSKKKAMPQELVSSIDPSNALIREPQIQEKIRQIALIERDEFEQFYRPLIEAVTLHLSVVNRENVNQEYFELVFKALRKRRSAIFEYGSSERDQNNKALWTLALFCATSIRHVVKQYQCCQFKYQGNLINPYLVPRKVLENSDVARNESSPLYQSSTTQVHLIDKLLSADIIDRFEKRGVYPFIINAVSGFYHERVNPFYSIINQVEAHMAGIELDNKQQFETNMKVVLKLIEQNTFSKNSKHSFVFEGLSHLLLDRNFLWELYRGYCVSESKPLGKKDFEQQLVDSFGLGESLEKNITFTFTLDGDKLDESQEKLSIELRNMVALAYKAVPYYRFTDRKKIKKNVLQRDIIAGDVRGGSAEEQDIDSSQSINESRSRAHNFPEGPTNPVGLKDLFSG